MYTITDKQFYFYFTFLTEYMDVYAQNYSTTDFFI